MITVYYYHHALLHGRSTSIDQYQLYQLLSNIIAMG